MSNNQLAVFQFNGTPVRTVNNNGEVYFVGKDVCDRLGYIDASNAMKQHCKGVVKRHPLLTAGGQQEMRILSEADVMRLICSSKLPEAEKFERWVFEEVLPSIRKTGRYAAASIPSTPYRYNGQPVYTLPQLQEILNISPTASRTIIHAAGSGLIDNVDIFRLQKLTQADTNAIGLPGWTPNLTLLTHSGLDKLKEFCSGRRFGRRGNIASQTALPSDNQSSAPAALTWYDYRGFKVTTSLELYRFNHTGQTFRQFSKTFSVWCRRNLKTDVDIFRSRSKANGSRLSLITESGAAKAIEYLRQREAEPSCTLTPISGVAPVAHIDLYRRPEQPAKDENSEMRGLHFTKLPYLKNQFKLSQLLEKCRDFGMDVNAETREFLLLFGAMHAIRLTATRGCVMSDGKGGFEYDIL